MDLDALSPVGVIRALHLHHETTHALLKQVIRMTDTLQSSVDQVKTDVAAIRAGFGTLQALTDRLANAIGSTPVSQDNSALITELQGIHGDLSTLSTSIAATVTADTPASSAAGTTPAPAPASGSGGS